MESISFEVNNGRTLELMQHEHDGVVSIHITDANGNTETIPQNEKFITPGEMVMLINYFRNCKNGTETSDYISR